MILLTYTESKTSYEVEFSNVSEHVVQTLGTLPAKLVGFELHRLDGTLLGDYSSYTTVYQVVEGGLQFSNDGSVYPEVSVPKPTLDERVTAIEQGQELQDGAIIDLANAVGGV